MAFWRILLKAIALRLAHSVKYNIDLFLKASMTGFTLSCTIFPQLLFFHLGFSIPHFNQSSIIPRCFEAEPICHEVTPVLADVGGGHRAACHLVK
jgi:hypothetical protein